MTFEEALSKGVPVLCYVSDKSPYHGDRQLKEVYTLSKKNTIYKYIDIEGISWKFAMPVKESDLNLLENL